MSKSFAIVFKDKHRRSSLKSFKTIKFLKWMYIVPKKLKTIKFLKWMYIVPKRLTDDKIP